MKMPQGKAFQLPFKDENEIPFGDERVCIVSVIGKSSLTYCPSKAFSLNDIIEKNVFKEPNFKERTEIDFNIEGYHDAENHVIYLYLSGIYDVHHIVTLCKSFSDNLRSKGFLHLWAEMKFCYAKALLFIFSISHIVLVVHPSPSFDISYVHLFRTIDNIRQKFQPILSETLKQIGVSGDWVQAGRPCSPRALFLLYAHHLNFSFDANDSNSNRSVKNFKASKLPPIKKLEHALEDQIYRILRKSRVITNISLNSLFAIPANQEFVYVESANEMQCDTIGHLLNLLQLRCQDVEQGRGGLLTLPRRKNTKPLDRSFRVFLQQHINLALHKGFDDNVGRHSGPLLFQRPTVSTWFKVASKLYEVFFEKDSEIISKSLGYLRLQVDTDGRFSENRCIKVLATASAVYQENLPSHYSSECHHIRMSQALHNFAQHVKGPAFDRYTQQLKEECTRIWKNGRQACEVYSLSGNRCQNRLHRLITDSVEDENMAEGAKGLLPVLSHNSQIRLISACNCGRKVAPREDPFDVKTANYDFYKQMMRECCEVLDRIEFPVYQSNVPELKVARLPPLKNTQGDSLRKALLSDSETLSLGQTESVDENILEVIGKMSLEPKTSDVPLSPSIVPISVAVLEEKLLRGVSPSTTNPECLPGMQHSESLPGLLPSYPSWSLICLGPSSLYSHNVGIHDQPGFITGTNFLLPWDVTVKTGVPQDRDANAKAHQEKESWPAVSELNIKKSSNPKGVRKGPRDYSEFTVKIFLGVEYECTCGHRFMCSEPDRLLKASGSGLVKENASKIASNEMPLYFVCPCREWTGKTQIAQLMRIHVVTPKAPVHVTLDPRVQPTPLPCPIFSPGISEPVKLTQSAYWILRLPFVYEGDNGPLLLKPDVNVLSYGRILKGMYGVVPIVGDR